MLGLIWIKSFYGTIRQGWGEIILPKSFGAI